MNTANSPGQPAATALLRERILQGLLQVIFIVAVIAFFLPNVTITIGVIGEQSLSMLGLVTSEIGNAVHGNSSSGQYYFHSISAPNFWDDIVGYRDGAGGVVCAVSLLFLMGHYLLTVVWGFFAFGLKQTHRFLDLLWLFAAAQYPILFSIGVQMMLDGMKGSFGESLVAEMNLQPGLATWLLMLLSWVALLLLLNPFSRHVTKACGGQIHELNLR